MTSDLCLDTALLLHTSPGTPSGLLECLVPFCQECVVWRWQDPNDITLARHWAYMHTDCHLPEALDA